MANIEDLSESSNNPRAKAVVGAVQLRKYGKFMEEYVDKLDRISHRMDDDESVIFGHDGITVKSSGEDPVHVADIMNTDNKVLNKVVTVMASLCVEVRDRVAEADIFYNSLLVFGEELDEGGAKALTATSKFLPQLQNLSNFVERCQTVVGEFLQQLSAIYTISTNNQIINSENIHFEDMMQHLGDMLIVLVTLDSLILSLEPIQESWSLYIKLIPTVQLSEGAEMKRNLMTAMKNIETVLLTGKIFSGAIDNLKGWRPSGSSVAEELQLYLRNMMESLEAKEPKLVDDSRRLFLRVGCILVFTALALGIHDKKLLKQTWEIGRKFPSVPLAGSCVWNPDEFLLQNMEHMLKADDKKNASTLHSARVDQLTQICRNLVNDLGRYSHEVCTWTIDFDTELSLENSQLTIKHLKRKCLVILRGIKLAGKIKRTLKLVMNLHASQGKPMTRSTVICLCGLTELLGALSYTFNVRSFYIAETTPYVKEYLAHEALQLVGSAMKKLTADKACMRRHLDALSALVLAQTALRGPMTAKRLLLARLALSVARGAQARLFREEEVEELYTIIQQLDQFASLETILKQACDTSHLYFQRVILPVYLDAARDTKLPYLVSELANSADIIPKDMRQETMEKFEKTIAEELENQTWRKTRETVESSLRLQVHAHLAKERSVPDVMSLRLSPFRLFERVVNVKSHVELYLDKTFYNLTTVALHDWRSYGEMRALARVQLGLTLVKDCLPCQTLEQGLDVLEVIRNIHVFVATYQYNMNNQLFVERESQNRHLNTICIRHVSNSIRTHGTGIVNTTVNFIYQFLRNKFYIFSQFLFDEQIKSRLTKDAMAWREAHARGVPSYPYERADKFVKGIRKLGMTENLSFLDQFRILITHIGNAMGYVRLVRSGGMHACSDSLSFLPESEMEFVEDCKGLSEVTVEASRKLDRVVQSLAANFADGSHYFKMLVDVFAADFRNPKHGHLNNFYMIVPPLTISYIDHMLTSKEKVARKKGTVWSEDGFAMGLAYVLTLLEQHDSLASLHWFNTTKEKYSADAATNVSGASSLTAKRLNDYTREFDLLAFNVNSAKIFFKKQVYEQEK